MIKSACFVGVSEILLVEAAPEMEQNSFMMGEIEEKMEREEKKARERNEFSYEFCYYAISLERVERRRNNVLLSCVAEMERINIHHNDTATSQGKARASFLLLKDCNNKSFVSTHLLSPLLLLLYASAVC